MTHRNTAKTHCIRGHPLSGENLIIRADGNRKCRTCKNDSRQPATHCRQGHPFMGANLIIEKNGRRCCRACKNERARAAYAGLTPEQKDALKAARVHVFDEPDGPVIERVSYRVARDPWAEAIFGRRV